jgi:hypothetical protein
VGSHEKDSPKIPPQTDDKEVKGGGTREKWPHPKSPSLRYAGATLAYACDRAYTTLGQNARVRHNSAFWRLECGV